MILITVLVFKNDIVFWNNKFLHILQRKIEARKKLKPEKKLSQTNNTLQK